MNNKQKKKGQIFSFDVIIAVFVLIMILTSSVWLWDTAREKIYLAEERNNLELTARNAIYTLIQTVGDPPTWHQLNNVDTNETNIYSLGIGKNRPWFISEDKAIRLKDINDTKYQMIKKILTVRNNDFYLNISKYNNINKKYENFVLIGKSPPQSAEQIIRIERIGLSDVDKSWMKIIIYVWKGCKGSYC